MTRLMTAFFITLIIFVISGTLFMGLVYLYDKMTLTQLGWLLVTMVIFLFLYIFSKVYNDIE